MTYSEPARTISRPIRIRWMRAAALLVAVAAIAAAAGNPLPAHSPSTESAPADIPRDERRAPPRRERREQARVPAAPVPGTAVQGEDPDVAHLDPALLEALREATADAAQDGVELVVVSGWRSPQHQQQLLQEAVSKYGSVEEAARWVARPETSAHVSGDAVDIGPAAARTWLSRHGVDHGLCQIYANEPWHFELRRDAIDQGCPRMYPDPTHDPRMQP